MKKIITILICAICITKLFCIEDNMLSFKKIDNNEGLSQNGVLVIFQDREGYMWFGTNYGLNRYDGFKIKTYYKGDSFNDLCGNTIKSILQDSAKNIWVATSEGIAVYNPITQRFYNLNKFASRKSIFSHNILSMRLIDGNIFISSSEELWRVNPGKKLFTEEIAKIVCNDINSVKIESTVNLKSIKIYNKDKNDSYWLTSNNLVYSAKIIGNKLILIDEIRINNDINVGINTLYEDRFSNIWIGTKEDGLYRIVNYKGNYFSTKVYPNKSSNTTFSRISDIISDNKDNIWITSRSYGVIIIPKSELGKKEIIPTKLNSSDLSSLQIRIIYISRDSTIWIGSLGNGLFYHNYSGKKFKNYQFGKKSINSSVNYTRSIDKDIYNRLWFGTQFEGLYIYDTEIQKVVSSLLKEQSVFALSQIDKEHFLAGTSEGLYLITYNKSSYKSEKLTSYNQIKAVVFSICNASNRYWLGTSDKLISFTLTSDYQITDVTSNTDKLLINLKSQNSIRCVQYDSKHHCLWIGSETTGLIKAELNKDLTIKTFYSISEKHENMRNTKYICDIRLDGDDLCWVATRNGLFQLKISKSGEITQSNRYTTRDGLPSNMIQSIRIDSSGNLWLGTIRGLAKFHKKTGEIIRYDMTDGIQDLEFAEHSSYSDNNGNMFFGGINGVSEFSTKEMRYDNFIEPVIIEDFFINGIKANYRINNSDSELISLSNSENSLKFNFITINFINPKKCKYVYMLEGFDKDWVSVSADNRTAEYINLPKGTYVFKVKASNEDGIWSKQYTSVAFKISPSFWLSYPGFIVYIFALIALVNIISLIIQRRLQKKNAELLEKQYNLQIEKINQSKLQLFINISHEIRTPLTLIVYSIEKLISKIGLSKEQEKEAETINKNVNRMLRLTNELLEIRKIETGNYQINVRENDIVSFIKDVIMTFEPLAEKQDIKLSIDTYKPEILIWYDANALEKMICNLISNAIKYTKKSGDILIKIYPSANNEFLEISVLDNGIGIEKTQLTKIFERFYHLGGNKDSYENGFGIGLSLTKNLIELHKGTITVISEINKGSVFTISLPLNENVYSAAEKVERIVWDSNLPSIYTSTASVNNDNEEYESTEIESFNSDSNKATILYVDDNKDLLISIGDHLSDNYNVITAENGKIGVEIANQYQPDIIISDIVMPEMDGIELCKTLKNDMNTSHIPIILLTAKGDSESHFEGLESGADYFIPKPFSIKLLDLTIKNLIESREKLRKLFINNEYEDLQEITTNSRDKEFMDKLLKYVEEHIGEEDLNIKLIADAFAISRSTFFRKIKAITGTTAKDFIDSIRLKKAAKLLIESDFNISEIAYEIGHSNPQYFSKWFKSFYKMSPTEYIATHKKNIIDSKSDV